MISIIATEQEDLYDVPKVQCSTKYNYGQKNWSIDYSATDSASGF